MATYSAIPDANLDPDSPARSIDALALRDNPLAIAEGAAGAPRIDPISAMSHGGEASAVGVWMFLENQSGSGVSAGQVELGSVLKYAGTGTTSATSPPGSWRCMGNASAGASTVWLRIL